MRGLRILVTTLGVLAQSALVGPPIAHNLGPQGTRGDFLSFYSGPILLERGQLYDPARTRQLQFSLGLRENQNALDFIRLPYYAHWLSPLARLPYDTALLIWLAINVAAVAAGMLLLARLAGVWALPAAAWFFPFSLAILVGQDTPLVMLALAGALVLQRKGRDRTAGFCLAMAAIKWHFLVGVPLYVLVRRRWQFGAGFSAGILLLLLWSTAVYPAWLWEYPAAILRPAVSPSPELMPNVAGLTHGHPFAGGALMMAVAAALFACLFRLPQEGLALSLTLLGSLLLAGHSYVGDGPVILPFLMLLAVSEYRTKWLAWVVLFPATMLLLLYRLPLAPQLLLVLLPLLLATELMLLRHD